MGVHESQSRILENQLGRSASFADWLFKKFSDYFGDIGFEDSTSFYKSINSVKNGFIRTSQMNYSIISMFYYVIGWRNGYLMETLMQMILSMSGMRNLRKILG